MSRTPLLKREDGQEETRERGDGLDADSGDVPAVNGEAAALDTLGLSSGDGVAATSETPLDTDYDNMWNGAVDSGPGLPRTPASVASADGGAFDLENIASGEVTLAEHLVDQINADVAEPRERLIAVQLVGALDDSGYLTADLDGLAEQLGCTRATLDGLVARLQGLDPTGVFARNLSECLALQLRERDRFDPAMATLVDNLELLAKRDFARLKRRCKVDDEDLTDMVAELRLLDPKPAQSFGAVDPRPITPDVLVRPDSGRGWIIELNAETLPRVLVDREYHARIGNTAPDDGTRAYLADRIQSANWLVKALDQRATTILKVAREIVRQQDGFLRHGVQHLRPLVLRDIAVAIDMHESTVSRVTSNKYISTPRGLFELKYFFTAAIAATSGGFQLSAESVRHKIKALIDAENPRKILSDDALVAKLRAEGIDIARRTVAKYREAMRIPSSVERRRMKSRPGIGTQFSTIPARQPCL